MGDRILVVDDDPAFGPILAGLLAQAGYETGCVAAGLDALERLEGESFDLVITDLLMPGMSGLELLDRLVETHSELPVLLISAQASIRDAVSALQRGAVDFVEKPVDREQLLLVVKKALALGGTEHRSEGSGRRPLDMVGLAAIAEDVERVAATEAAVLLLGETGTGKSVLAREIHARSHRSDGPFVVVDCGALPESLIESELFGHVKGAFTGASSSRPGAARCAEGGTLFLDEVGDLPPTAQVKLLRLLQDREVRPVGSDVPVRVDLRIVSATRHDLGERVRAGKFRDDLFFRLAVVPIELPPLRHRLGAVGSLARSALERHARGLGRHLSWSDEALVALEAHGWPGNLRELENVVGRIAILARGPGVEADDVARWLTPGGDTPAAAPPEAESGASEAGTGGLTERRRASERQAVVDALRLTGGNRTRAAGLLGVSRRTLYNKIRDLRIDLRSVRT